MTMVVRSCIREGQKRLYTKNEKVQCAKNLYQPSMCFFSRWWLSRERIKMFVHIYQINEIVEKIRWWILIQEMKVWIYRIKMTSFWQLPYLLNNRFFILIKSTTNLLDFIFIFQSFLNNRDILVAFLGPGVPKSTSTWNDCCNNTK